MNLRDTYCFINIIIELHAEGERAEMTRKILIVIYNVLAMYYSVYVCYYSNISYIIREHIHTGIGMPLYFGRVPFNTFMYFDFIGNPYF